MHIVNNKINLATKSEFFSYIGDTDKNYYILLDCVRKVNNMFQLYFDYHFQISESMNVIKHKHFGIT